MIIIKAIDNTKFGLKNTETANNLHFYIIFPEAMQKNCKTGNKKHIT